MTRLGEALRAGQKAFKKADDAYLERVGNYNQRFARALRDAPQEIAYFINTPHGKERITADEYVYKYLFGKQQAHYHRQISVNVTELGNVPGKRWNESFMQTFIPAFLGTLIHGKSGK